jgi:hypothetical protein
VPRRRLALVVIPVVAALVGVGCMEGERPVLIAATDTDSATGDPIIDEVLGRLEAGESSTFEARFEIHTLLGNTFTDAEVAQEGPRRRGVRIGDVLYRDGTERDPVTCDAVSGVCVEGLDDSRVAALMITRTFYGTSAAARLQQAARVALGPAAAATRDIAGQSARCVIVDVEGGSPEYCVLDDGVLAYYSGADAEIRLEEYRTELTEDLGVRLLDGAVTDTSS